MKTHNIFVMMFASDDLIKTLTNYLLTVCEKLGYVKYITFITIYMEYQYHGRMVFLDQWTNLNNDQFSISFLALSYIIGYSFYFKTFNNNALYKSTIKI